MRFLIPVLVGGLVVTSFLQSWKLCEMTTTQRTRDRQIATLAIQLHEVTQLMLRQVRSDNVRLSRQLHEANIAAPAVHPNIWALAAVVTPGSAVGLPDPSCQVRRDPQPMTDEQRGRLEALVRAPNVAVPVPATPGMAGTTWAVGTMPDTASAGTRMVVTGIGSGMWQVQAGE